VKNTVGQSRAPKVATRLAGGDVKTRKLIMLRLFALIGALWVWFLTPAGAQQVGDPEAGLAVAAEVCAECQEVMPVEGLSPDLPPLPFEVGEAMTFEEIGNTPGVTAMAVFAWRQSTHPTMPNIVREEYDLRNVVAYILSLKDE
jgi:mono/diheme cytochrome c family protein